MFGLLRRLWARTPTDPADAILGAIDTHGAMDMGSLVTLICDRGGANRAEEVTAALGRLAAAGRILVDPKPLGAGGSRLRIMMVTRSGAAA